MTATASTTTAVKHGGPLSGVRIADISQYQTATSASMLLAFLGAEVIKIESMERLDRFRRMPEGLDHNFIFHEYNAGKLSVRLNLKHAEGAELAKKLILEHCDGLMSNFRAAAMDRVGLGYAALRETRRDLVIVSISNSGTEGPESHLPGYATTFVAAGGLAHLSGYEDGPPSELIAWPDTSTGVWGAFAMMAGLMRSRRTGQGIYLDVSGREWVTSMIGDVMLDYFINQRTARRRGNDDEIAAPHNCYQCQGDDRWLSIAVSNDVQWASLRAAMGEPTWADDARFADQGGRWEHRREIDERLSEWTRDQDAEALTQQLWEHRVPASAVLSGKDLVENEHLRARDAFVPVHHPMVGERAMVCPPWRFERMPARIAKAAPWLGEGDDYVLRELLGLSDDEVTRLINEQAVY